MRRTWWAAGAAPALVALSGLGAPGAPARQARPLAPAARELLPGTQSLFDGYVRQNKMPGIVGAFGIGDLPTVFVDAGRIADDPGAPPADADSLWRVYSMTKPVTAMAAMMLLEQGRVGLDQPVSDFVPAFRRMRVLTDPAHGFATRPAASAITIRHLLTHTAGLGYSITATGPLLHEYERLGLVPFAVNPQVEARVRPTRPRTLAEFADRAASAPLVADPGARWEYSMGLDVLARVVEVAGGMPFERFLQTRLFGPLGMTSTFFTVPRGEAGRLATAYAFVGDARVPVDRGATSVFLRPPSFPYGGAGLVSSARDYDRFLHMLQDGGELDGVRVLKPETVRLALSNLLPPGVSYVGPGGVPAGFGAGGSVTLADRPGGAAKGTYGWGGAAGTLAWVDPARRARGVVMVNYTPADRWPVRDEVAAALLSDASWLRR